MNRAKLRRALALVVDFFPERTVIRGVPYTASLEFDVVRTLTLPSDGGPILVVRTHAGAGQAIYTREGVRTLIEELELIESRM